MSGEMITTPLQTAKTRGSAESVEDKRKPTPPRKEQRRGGSSECCDDNRRPVNIPKNKTFRGSAEVADCPPKPKKKDGPCGSAEDTDDVPKPKKRGKSVGSAEHVSTGTSPEPKPSDRKTAKTQSSEPIIAGSCEPLKNQEQQPLPPLIQIECDEFWRVNRQIEDEKFYHGWMNKEETERLLTREGQFLVRKDEIAGHDVFVLSVFHEGSVKQYRIRTTNTRHLYFVYKYAFNSLGQMIQYHRRNGEPVFSDGCLLLEERQKEEWQLNHEQVEKDDVLGAGAFGQVWKGKLEVSPFHPKVNVAIKTLNAHALSGGERIKFLREAHVMMDLKHENVIRFYGVCALKEPIMIVMELAGQSLHSRIKDTTAPLTLDEKLNLCFGAACGLAYLERKGIIHRDIAARNCLLGDQNQVKISDFGLSQLGIEFRDVTLKNVPLRWMAPETLGQKLYSTKSDVYSYGVVIWEVYSAGQEPFAEHENDKILWKLIVKHKVSLTVTDEIQPAVEAIRRRCNDPDPEKRPKFADIERELKEMPGIVKPSKETPFSRLVAKLKSFFCC